MFRKRFQSLHRKVTVGRREKRNVSNAASGHLATVGNSLVRFMGCKPNKQSEGPSRSHTCVQRQATRKVAAAWEADLTRCGNIASSITDKPDLKLKGNDDVRI